MAIASATPYDAVRYRTEPNPVANPSRIAAIGRLHGLRTADPSHARVLEIGCGDGGHLLPLAATHPDARFVGCDLAPTAVAEARRVAAAARIGNVAFHVADVRSLPVAGPFDCVIAHGLYSWIPPDARDALLAACGSLLADEGIAFVSYNALPGGHLRRMARDILLFHVAGIAEPAARLAEARALARLLTTEGDRENAANAALRYEMRQILERSDQALVHDDLAEHQHAVTFTEFVQHAGAHGLRFVADAEYFTDGDLGLSAPTRAILAGMERLAREQYRDFLGGRRFRQTLLCRANRTVSDAPDATAVDGLFVCVPRAGATSAPAESLPEAGALEVRVRALVEAVHAAAPRALAFRDAAAAFGAELANAASRDELRAVIVDGFRTGRLQLTASPSAAQHDVAPLPRASAYARLQADEGDVVTSPDLLSIRLDDARARALFQLLDGTHDAAGLVRLLEADGQPVAPDWVRLSLARFAKLGLITG